MARAPSSILIFLRQNPRARQNPNTQIRYHTTETKECDFTEVAQHICKIIRTKPRWEQTLPSEYPSFNFSDPQFFTELLKLQKNVLLSLRFFFWLRSHNGFSPDPISCKALFSALVEAKACNAAKSFLEHTSFSPEPASLESYIQCLCEGGYIQDAIDVFYRLKEAGVCPAIMTWNAALSGCLKVRRTDIIWKLYQEMIECGVVADVDVETVGYLIQAFCADNRVSEGYELLRQVLVNGLVPENAAFNTLISGFCKEKQYTRVSELLHTMIAKNCVPDNYTYQGVINWLCKKGKGLEGLRVFNDLKDRGYAPDIVMYTTMIHGLCTMGWLGEARKLWFEMIEKGYHPNEYTYNTMIHGFCKIDNFEEAKTLYKEMCNKGHKETTVSYNAMMTGLCLHGRTDEAYRLFQEMHQKGIVRDLITYNTVIQGFCKEGKIVESMNLFRELLAQGLQPQLTHTPHLLKSFVRLELYKKQKVCGMI
ncbi:pentatricopeptide repeat-containing protein [Prunus yedoensis var. nudiflora]|uniref:Pentatricopeptide repeat-containing protein n=1 Tax=Prunus yedoensis var. nudiflora TaxID=2094558 RepID=A0A314UL18_PRUYE|nr:pentatricopeptide repeat-containing protein [Prunus yedoensis var. nudiflora]